jgi:hypothetical protein
VSIFLNIHARSWSGDRIASKNSFVGCFSRPTASKIEEFEATFEGGKPVRPTASVGTIICFWVFLGRNKIFKEYDWTQPNRRQGDLGNGFRRMRSRILEVRLDFYSEQFLFEQTFSFSSFRKRKWKIKTTFAGVRPRAVTLSASAVWRDPTFSCNKRFTLRPPFLSGRFERVFVTPTGQRYLKESKSRPAHLFRHVEYFRARHSGSRCALHL